MDFRGLIIGVLCSASLMAQQSAPTDTTKSEPTHWKQNLVTSFTITQQSYSNWAQGDLTHSRTM